MYDTIFAEQHHKPAVALVNQGFAHDARSAAAGRGMPAVRFVPETVPCECVVPDRVGVGVSAAMDEIIAALTTPLRPEEVSPPPRPVERTRGIVFDGEFEEVQEFFYRRGWSDGLPIRPPTQDAVDRLLGGTDLPPEHVVGKMIPRHGKATVEKIAINAAMAGALPTAMPVLIAAVEALLDPLSAFGTFEVSTGSWAPFYILNGPIRDQLNVNSGSGALSPGDLANATIGRAMGLIVKNLGGARKGLEDMGVLGNPGKYAMVIGEHESAAPSPWEPQHIQLGYPADTSTVTVSFPNAYVQVFPRRSDPQGIIEAIGARLGPQWQQVTVLVSPTHAETLATAGWTKASLASEIERAMPPRPQGTALTAISGPDSVRVVVVGGPGMFISLTLGVGRWVTRPIALPRAWDSLVSAHRDLVPRYQRY